MPLAPDVVGSLRRDELQARCEQLQEVAVDATGKLWQAVTSLENYEYELRLSRAETIQRLAIAAELRDDETGKHIYRMSRYCAALARASGEDPVRCETLLLASQLHDVGKIGIPDSILLKPGPLTGDERAIMEQHAQIGYQILSGSQSDLLVTAASIAYTHHERMDGTGYPRGIEGTLIPIEGRIAAIADVFDALTSNRVYRKALPAEQALDIMRADHNHFDPWLFDIFLVSVDDLLEIRDELQEEEFLPFNQGFQALNH